MGSRDRVRVFPSLTAVTLFTTIAAMKFPDTSCRFLFVTALLLPARSEEHTSELQSHSDLVCRLLLEKKNTGDTLCDEDYPSLLEPATFHDPVIRMAIEQNEQCHEKKTDIVLQRLT